METLQNRVINKQTNTLTKMDGELTDMSLKLDAMDEGVKTGFSRVNKDLGALDSRVNRCCKDYKSVVEKLKAAEGRIELLEERSCTDSDMIEKLFARVESMEDRLCHCSEGKEKGKAVEVLSSTILGSPLVLDCPLAGSDGSYHTPLIVSSEASSSSSGPNKENIAVDSQLVEIKDKVMEDLVLNGKFNSRMCHIIWLPLTSEPMIQWHLSVAADVQRALFSSPSVDRPMCAKHNHTNTAWSVCTSIMYKYMSYAIQYITLLLSSLLPPSSTFNSPLR